MAYVPGSYSATRSHRGAGVQRVDEFQLEIETEGFEELAQKLEELAPKVARKALRRAAKDAGDIWLTAISDNAPELTGFLKSEINEMSRSKGDSVQVKVGPSDAPYTLKPQPSRTAENVALFREFGTHWQAPKPFMRPAFESTKDLVMEVFTEDLNDELEALKE